MTPTLTERVARSLIGVHGAPIDASVEDMTPLAQAAIQAMGVEALLREIADAHSAEYGQLIARQALDAWRGG